MDKSLINNPFIVGKYLSDGIHMTATHGLYR